MRWRRIAVAASGLAALWFLCGFLAIGFQNAADLHDHCGQRFTPVFRQLDHSRTALMPLGGPFALLMALGWTNFGQTGWTLTSDCP